MLRTVLLLIGLSIALAVPSRASTIYQQLHASPGGPTDAEYLPDAVIEGSDGRIYGASINGGPQDGGVVFAMNKDGSDYVILHSFTVSTNDGLSPWGGVIQGSDGFLYGATREGGAHGVGTVFRLSTNGTGFAIVRSFTTNANDGSHPMNSVIEGSDGMLYGRTCRGGTNDANSIFRMRKDGSDYKLLHSFTDAIFSLDPLSGLIEGSDGKLYGTTYAEGLHDAGSVFRIDKSGDNFQSLRDFQESTTEGSYLYGGLHEASDGFLYGTTSYGGPDDYGSLFRINKDGSGYKVLRFFTSENDEGYLPCAPPVEGPGGWLYGSTYFGGENDGGVLYCVRKDGSDYTVLHKFLWNNIDGTNPNAPLLRASDGALYGTTYWGGGQIDGTVFRIKPCALSVEKKPVGAEVAIEGFISHRYALDAADTLPPAWNEIAVLTNLTGTVKHPDPTNAATRFYRARILNP